MNPRSPTKMGHSPPAFRFISHFPSFTSLCGSRGTLFRSVPLFFIRPSFFRVEVWKADEESRVTTQNPLLKRSRFPPPFPSDVLFAREGGKPTCRSDLRDFGSKKAEKESRAKKAWRPPSSLQSNNPSFFHLCIPAKIAASPSLFSILLSQQT